MGHSKAHVLDICTGSGALGFEALSRGAASVYMIEPDKTQARFLKDNIQLLKAQNCHLINATAQQALPRLKEQFDVVFLDPPYSLNLWQELAHLADIHIKNNGYIYVEADRDLSQLHLPATWQQVKTTKAGTVHAGLYQKSKRIKGSLKLPFSLQSFKLTQTNHCNKCCTGTYNFCHMAHNV